MQAIDPVQNGRRFNPTWAAHGTLIAAAVWTAFNPIETSPLTAIVLAGVAWLMLPWAAQRWPAPGRLIMVGPVLALLIVSAAGGWDRATAISETGLLGAIICMVFLASRELPPETAFAWFAMGLAALSIVGIWQIMYGLNEVALVVDQLPLHMQQPVATRLARGRAFASLLTPGHFAVLLATALPLLLGGCRCMSRVNRWTGIALCILGLLLSASSLGIGLALVAWLATVIKSQRVWTTLALAAIGCAVITTVMIRTPAANLEPLRLRADNWQTAIWLWSTSPLAGVGLGSYGQASQAVPFLVGNRPLHAHCLPLEWTAEMGISGLALAVIAGMALWRLLRRLWPTRPELAIALAVIPIHNLADFSLYTSGVAIPWALLLGWAIAVAKPPETTSLVVLSRRVRTWAMAGAGALVIVVSLSATSAKLVQAATEGETEPRLAFDAAQHAHRLAPWRAEPVSAALNAAVNSDETSECSTANITDGWWIRPSSAMWAAFRCQLALAKGQGPTAVMEAWAATHSQPSSQLNSDNLIELISLLEARPGNEAD